MATVYLHIGTMKTGTSAIQRFLFENRKYLKSQGYAYPVMKQGLPSKYAFRNGHFILYLTGREKALKIDVDEQKVLQDAFEQIGKVAKEFEHIILSDELIWHYSATDSEFWQKLKERFRAIDCDLKVIVYLRRQDTFAESLYSHEIKSRDIFHGDFSEYIKGNMAELFVFDYYGNIRKIEACLGKENVLLRTYDKGRLAGKNTMILSDFLETVGLTFDENYKTQESAKNSGLEGNYVEFKRLVNAVPEYRGLDNFLKKPLALASSAMTEGKLRSRAGYFTETERKEFLSRFEEGNRRIAEEYFGREDGKLFGDESERLPAWKLDRDNLFQDTVLFMTEAFCQQEKKIGALEDEMKSLKKSEKAGESGFLQRVYRKIRNLLKGRK